MGLLDLVVPSVPGQVAATASFDVGDETTLWPAELAAIRRAVPKRRSEYAAARECARAALAQIGFGPVPILNRDDRSPIWPAGVVGSLTHTDGYSAAAVARAGALVSIGIDAEQNLPLPSEVESQVLTADDVAGLAGLPDRGTHWNRLVFSVKEATFKAWSPLTGRWLGFEDAVVSIDPDGQVSVGLLVGGLVVDGRERRVLTGRWACGDGYLVSCITVWT